MKIENLNQLPLNKSGKINKIKCDEGIKRRLLDMGLIVHRYNVNNVKEQRSDINVLYIELECFEQRFHSLKRVKEQIFIFFNEAQYQLQTKHNDLSVTCIEIFINNLNRCLFDFIDADFIDVFIIT